MFNLQNLKIFWLICVREHLYTMFYRIHELQTMKQVALLEAHDSEVLCLEFTPPNFGK